jgi:hypothetical protein
LAEVVEEEALAVVAAVLVDSEQAVTMLYLQPHLIQSLLVLGAQE